MANIQIDENEKAMQNMIAEHIWEGRHPHVTAGNGINGFVMPKSAGDGEKGCGYKFEEAV